mgnify:CR=1 FL=1
MTNYRCRRCLSYFIQKNDIIRHLNRKKQCMKIGSAYIMDDQELYDISIIKLNKNNRSFCFKATQPLVGAKLFFATCKNMALPLFLIVGLIL